jgi:hypothetical protein
MMTKHCNVDRVGDHADIDHPVRGSGSPSCHSDGGRRLHARLARQWFNAWSNPGVDVRRHVLINPSVMLPLSISKLHEMFFLFVFCIRVYIMYLKF